MFETQERRQARWPAGSYTLLLDHHFDRHLQHDFSKGDLIELDREDALRLGMAGCIAKTDSAEAVAARNSPEEVRQQRIREMEAEIEHLREQSEAARRKAEQDSE